MKKILQTMAFAALSASALCAGAYAADSSFAQIQRGKELVNAGDCVACHSVEGGKPFAGGRAIPTPFGIIYSPNLTPDTDSGIGGWTDDDFYRAMHEGIRPDGSRLYPAFPYPYFTKMTRDDVKAIHAYLKTLQPAKGPRKDPKLRWPLNHRVVMRGWNMMFFKPGTYRIDPNKSDEWNRGAYLVEGPGHCGACHTPKNALGADKTKEALTGGLIQGWFAPKIANNMHDGTGAWSVDDIVEYLKTGRNAHSGAAGLMGEVVRDSTSKLPDKDLHAIAVYIKDVDGGPAPTGPGPKPDDKLMAAGKAIFADSCSGCHQADGKGVPRMFPPLAGNSNVQQHDSTTVVRVILEGAEMAATDKRPTQFSMPSYAWKLKDDEVAAVATYVRNSWGNSAPPVKPDDVRDARKKLHKEHTSGS